jgi:HAD superfamily hydrolase (TIGR01509 family)
MAILDSGGAVRWRHRRVQLVSRPPATLVIFDCDGVLVDTEAISCRVLARAATAEGLPMTAAEAMAAYRGHFLGYVTDDLERRLGRRLSDAWTGDFEAARADAFRTEVRAIPGAAVAIEGVLAAGVAICVASQAKPEKMRLALGLTGLSPHLPERVRFSAWSVARPKPAPDLFLHAAATMGHPPQRCVVVEDSVAGVTAANAAGMRVLAYAADADPAALAAAGGEPVYDMRDVPARVLG